MPHFSEFAWEDNESTLQTNAAFLPSTLSNALDTLESWTYDNHDMTFDLDDTNCMSLSEPWMTPASSSKASQTQLNGMLSPAGQVVPAERKASMGTAAIAAMTSQSGDSHHTKQAHDCEALALSVLRSLHHSPSAVPPVQVENNSEEASDATTGAMPAKPACAMPSVDTVLFANKAALSNLTRLLQCPCAQTAHVALLHSAILSKVMFWYRVAVTARYHSEPVDLRPVKIQLGMLDLDDDDQATLQRAVLLRELRKAERVIEAFDACSAPEDDYEGANASHWHGLAIRNMREELHAIIQETKRGQSE